MRRMRIAVPEGDTVSIDAILSISFPFQLPVEEPFELTSPSLR